MHLELFLISHQVVICTVVVLPQLIIQCLSADLHTDAQHYLNVYHLLFQSRIQNPEMAFARLFDRVVLLVFFSHDFVQVDFIVEELIKLKTFKWLEHLFYLLVGSLNQSFVFNFKLQLCDQNVFLLNTSRLLFNYANEY